MAPVTEALGWILSLAPLIHGVMRMVTGEDRPAASEASEDTDRSQRGEVAP